VLVTLPINPTSAAGARQVMIGEASGNIGYRLTMGYCLSGGRWQGVLDTVADGIAAPLLVQPTGGDTLIGGRADIAGDLTRAGARVWDAANDGAGSGMDADLLDGWQMLDIRQWANLLGVPAAFPPSAHSHAVTDIPGVWHVGNDGAGSGLDADLLDGWQMLDIRNWANLIDKPAAFPPSAHSHGAADIAGAFTGSHQGTGYEILPDGLILQWGHIVLGDSSGVSRVTFPVAFPTACFAHGASNDSGASVAAAWAGTGDASREGMAVSHTKSALVASAAGTAAFWWAIGK
jgi:hypothetical protein